MCEEGGEREGRRERREEREKGGESKKFAGRQELATWIENVRVCVWRKKLQVINWAAVGEDAKGN